jgi:Aromatic-ring-opening dioxygenase LigAB, LigA subunit
MSIYAVNRVCRDALHDAAFRAALQKDPGAALKDRDLTDAERTALLAGDVATLYRMGAAAFLLCYLTRWSLFGLTVPVYSTRMRSAA